MPISPRNGSTRSSIQPIDRLPSADDGHFVLEATRLVFCIYSGIRVDAVKIGPDAAVVQYAEYHTLPGPLLAEEYAQMVLSGGIGERRLCGSDSSSPEDDLQTCREVYSMTSRTGMNGPAEFDAMLGRCRRRVLFHLADPKMRAAIRFAASELSSLDADIEDDDLDQLVGRVRDRMMTRRKDSVSN